VLVDSDKLMGAAEVSARLNVGRTRLRELQRRPDFPQPIKRLTGMWIWDGAAVEAWIAEHRPPKDDDAEA
jgi:predicted DNA-binding transcriptional regulator AlpA